MSDSFSVSAELDMRLQEAEEFCKRQGKRFTDIRRQVLSIILQNDKYSKAYEVLDALLEIQPNAKPVTVYRSLEFLEEVGLIHRLSGLNAWTGCSHIGCHDAGHSEVLAVCVDCGQVTEMDLPEVYAAIDTAVRNKGLTSLSKQIEVQVRCPNCSK